MILRNKMRATLVYTLSHETYCGTGKCACNKKGSVTVFESKQAAGFAVMAKKKHARTFAPVLTLLPLERKNVPDTVMDDETIARDVRANKLQVVGNIGKAVAGASKDAGPVRGRSRRN